MGTTAAASGTAVPSATATGAAGGPQRVITRGTGGERVLWALLAAAVVAIAVVPLAYVVDSAFYRETDVGLAGERSLAAIAGVYASAEYLGFLLNALAIATLVTIVSLAVGVAMALLVARTDIPGKGALDFLIIMPLFLSPFTGLIAWIALGSEKTGFFNVSLGALLRTVGIDPAPLVNVWSFGGVVWVMFLFFCPFAYLFTLGSMRAMDSSLEEAARTTGASPLQTLLRVTLPMSMPAVLASGLLVFILAAETYTIPGIIGETVGFTTLPWRIFQDATVFPTRQAHAAAAGTLLLWVTVLGVWLQHRVTRRSERYVTVSGKGFRGRLLPLGKARWAALAFVGLYVFCADLLPFGALLLSSFMKFSAPMITADIFTLKHYADIATLQDMRQALWNTLWLAVLSGALCVVVGLLISFLEVRRRSAATKLLAFLGVLPVAVPGLVYGMGLIWAYVRTPVYGTAWIILLAFVAKFLPYGIVVSRSAILQVHPELEQSARMSGATGLVALRKITLPLLKPTLIAILFFVMLNSIKELSASVLLSTQQTPVLSVLTWSYMDAGNYQFAAAIGVVQTLLMIGLVFLTRAVFQVRLEKSLVNA